MSLGRLSMSSQRLIIFALKFSRSILTPTYQKSFILGPYVLCEAGFPFMPSDHRVHARGLGLQGPNPVHVQNVVFLG